MMDRNIDVVVITKDYLQELQSKIYDQVLFIDYRSREVNILPRNEATDKSMFYIVFFLFLACIMQCSVESSR